MIVSFNFVVLCTGQLAVDYDEVGFSDIKLDNDRHSGKLILRRCEYFVQRSELLGMTGSLSSKFDLSSMFSAAGVNIPVTGFSSHFSKFS